MGRLSSLLYGALSGAAMMYFMDKDQGARRRALVRDRVQSMRYELDDAIDTSVQDLRNRARGILAEGMATVSGEPVNDQVLAERVRARLGFLARHPGAIDVMAQNGVITLNGDALTAEVNGLLRGIGKMRGVQRVENRLRVHETAGNIPQLQGQGWMPGEGRGGGQWTPSSRLLAGAGSLYLFLYGLVRGGFIGTLAQMGALGLGVRAVGNMDFKRLVGTTDQDDAIRVRKSVNIQAPVDEVYGLWSNFENFPRFMANVEQIQNLGDNRSHWVVKGPAGAKVEFDAVMTENRPNELIAWETVAESQVKHHGQVRFKEGAREGTQVNVSMAYTPPAGVVGHAVANVFGVDPKSAMDKDLMRLKSLLEEGKTRVAGKKVTRAEVPVTGQQHEQNMGQQERGTSQRGRSMDDLRAVDVGESCSDRDQLEDEMGDLGTLTDMDDLDRDHPFRNSE